MALQKLSQVLDSYLHPQSFPVVIRMISSADKIPEEARMPKRDLGTAMALCQGVALARRSGWLIAMGNEDMLCPLGALTLGFVPARAKFLDGSFDVPFWVKDQSIRAKMAQALPQLELGKYTHILAAPIHRADFEPHVVIVYGNPAQIARLAQAAVYETGEPVTSSSVGGFACGGEITNTMLNDQCQCILTGGGDRIIAQAQDQEAAFAIPMSKVEAIMEGLEATHRAGMRYPTPYSPGFRTQFPPSFNELMDYLRQGS